MTKKVAASKSKLPKAIIVIPTYNERENITRLIPVLDEVAARITTWNVEFLVVDDTSPDKTYEAVEKLQKKYPRLHLLVNPQKAGLGGAYMKGMHEAFENLGAEVIFEFDADFSHDPQKIPEFLAKIDEGYDFVIGGRYKDGGSIDPDWPFIRKFYSVVGNFIIMLVLTDFSIRDWTSGYRAIRKSVYEAVIPKLQGERFSGYTWQIGLLHQAVRAGFKITEVPIQFVDRKIGESKLGAEYIKNTLLYIFQVRWEELIHSRIFKFVIVGGCGALVQLLIFQLLRWLTGQPQNWLLNLSQFISIEAAIVFNFIMNNSWTFKAQKITGGKIVGSFLKFNLSSFGSIIIQMIVMAIGMWLAPEWKILFVDAPLAYSGIGILLGMVWNYFAYNKFIWRTKKGSVSAAK